MCGMQMEQNYIAYMCEQRGIRLIKLPMKGTELDYADSLKRAFQNVHIFISCLNDKCVREKDRNRRKGNRYGSKN